MKVIYQCQKKGCGYACVKMLASHYLKRSDIQTTLEPECAETAPSLKELIQYGRGLGLPLKAYRFASIKSCFDFRPSPFLAVIKVGGLSHMVLIQKRKGPLVFYLDPAAGRCILSCKEIDNLFDGIALFANEKEFSNKNVSKSIGKNENGSGNALLPVILAFFPGLFFTLRILLQDTISARVLTSFTILGALLLGLEIVLIVFCLRSFDREYSNELISISRDKRKEAFEAYYGFREVQIPGRCRAATMFSITLSFACYYLKNVLKPVPIGWCVFGLSLLVLVFSRAFERKMERATSRSEDAFINETKESQLLLKLNKIRKNGRSYSLFLGLFLLFLLLSSNFLAMFGQPRGWDFSKAIFSFFLLLQIRSTIFSFEVFKTAKQKGAYFRFFFPRRSKRNIRKTKPKKGKIAL